MRTLTWTIAKYLLVLGLLLGASGCATTNHDWQDASRLRTVEAHEQFLRNHSDAEQAAMARSRMADLQASRDWSQAEATNTIEGYSDFLNQHPQAKQATQASAQLEQLKVRRDWESAQSSGTIASYDEFIQRHSNSKQASEAKKERARLELERDWKSVQELNIPSAFKEFLKEHPSSQYTADAMKRVAVLQLDEAWKDAVNKNSEAGWRDFIATYSDSPKCEAAVSRLRNIQGSKPGSFSVFEGKKKLMTLRGQLIMAYSASLFGTGTYYDYDTGALVSRMGSPTMKITSECKQFTIEMTKGTKLDSSFGSQLSGGFMQIDLNATYRVVGHIRGDTIVAIEVAKE